MILSAHQPAYLPWLPLLDLIAQSDVFVVLDAVQFEKGSFVNRNKILLNGKEHWLTIPVHAHDKSTIADTKIDWEQPWLRKHCESVKHAYGKSSSLESWLKHIETLAECRHLGPLAIRDLEFWCKQFGITTPIKMMPLKKRKPGGTELILDLMADFKADTYLAGPLFKNYVNEELWQSSPYSWITHKVSPALEALPPLSALHYWMTGIDNPFSSSPDIQMTKPLDAEEPSAVLSHRDFRSTSSL